MTTFANNNIADIANDKAIIYNGSVVFMGEHKNGYVFGVNFKGDHKFVVTDFSCDRTFESKWFKGTAVGTPLTEVKGITSFTKVARVIR